MSSLSVSLITKNPGDFLRSCLATVRPYVDEIIIVDSDSTDNTFQISKEFNANFVTCNEKTHPDWFLYDEDTAQWFMGREDLIRQLSFDASPCDFRLWIDADDQVIDAQNLPWIANQMEEQKLDVAWLYYDYARFHNGNVGLTLERERIIRRGVSKWEFAAHSVHGAQYTTTERQALFDNVRIDHCHGDAAQLAGKPGPTPKCRGYKALWAYHVKMNGNSPVRDLFYLGRESIGFAPDIAFKWFKEVLKHPDANPVMRACSFFHMAKLLEMKGESKKAYDYFLKAANVKLATGEYVEALNSAAKIAYEQGRKKDCERLLARCIEYGHDRAVIPVDPATVRNATRVFVALQKEKENVQGTGLAHTSHARVAKKTKGARGKKRQVSRDRKLRRPVGQVAP